VFAVTPSGGQFPNLGGHPENRHRNSYTDLYVFDPLFLVMLVRSLNGLAVREAFFVNLGSVGVARVKLSPPGSSTSSSPCYWPYRAA
jgi:hypothetical protein